MPRSLPVGLALLVSLIACGGEERPPQVPEAAPIPRDPPWLGKAAETCAKIASCPAGATPSASGALRSRDAGACVASWLAQPEALQTCFRAARTCADVEQCRTGGGDARAASFCAQRTGVVSGCDGDRLVTCGDADRSSSTVMDCAALGATCREQRSGSGIVVRACFSADRCPANAPESRCDGTSAIITCHDGAVERVACGAGARCREKNDDNGEPTAICELPRGGCSLLGSRGCEGDRLVSCEKGRATITDCAAAGLRCSGEGPRAGCFVPANVECDAERLPTCEGEQLTFCALGRLVRVPCGGPCSTGGSAVAACSPKPAP